MAAGTPQVRVRLLDPALAADRSSLAERLAEHDDRLLAAFVDGNPVRAPQVRAALAAQTAAGTIRPVFMGSAATGVGVAELLASIAGVLPAATGDPTGVLAGRVFKIERAAGGERLAYVRLRSGSLHLRDHVAYAGGREGRVTSLAVFGPSGPRAANEATSGQIAKVAGLDGIRIGDRLGPELPDGDGPAFPPPALESVVTPRRPAMAGRLRAALNELAEQDPLIDVRQDDLGEIAVSLYGEVQKEVIGETLARDYGVEVDFRGTTTVCIERLVVIGEALEVIHAATHTNISGKSSPDSRNPFGATLGLRVEPGPAGSGVAFRLAPELDVKLMPLQVFNTVEQFAAQLGRYVAEALEEGVHGWRLTDCTVTVIDSGYWRTGTSAADFRRLAPLVLAAAVREAGVVVCEPMTAVRIDSPPDSGGRIVPVLLGLGARILGQHTAERTTIVALVQAGRVHEVQNRLPGLTGGEGSLETSFGGYVPVTTDPPPSRRRSRPNPYNREAYLIALGIRP